MAQGSSDDIPHKVWDPWVRLFHWSLVACIAAAAWTGFLAGPSFIVVHVVGGLGAAALVLMRIVWGFTGPTHARFSDFLPRPSDVIDHLKGRGHRHLGHNPLGALMVLALILTILAVTVTGIGVLGGQLRTGPFAADLGVAAGFLFREAHNILGGLLVYLVVFHLGGVIWESRRSSENLTLSMITGEKEARPGDAPVRSIPARMTIAAAAIAVAAVVLVASNSVLSARAVPGLPVTKMDPTVANECGACHMVYNPSLLPAVSWKKIMANLSNHFGEDASLDPKTAAKIEAWLVAHAAGTVDTYPARIFSRSTDPTPISMTATRFWKRMHERISAATFKSAKVGGPSNCAACHKDAASGLFSPFAISMPEESE